MRAIVRLWTRDRSIPSAQSERTGLPRFESRCWWRSVRRFARGQCAAAAIEAALGITVLVVTLAVLMEIVDEVYTRDAMARAARAAARALAIDAGADPCVAIRRELNRSENFDCDTQLKAQAYHEVTPEMLSATLDAGAVGGGGELVLYTIAWEEPPWSFSAFSQGEGGQDAGSSRRIVMGLARRE